MKHKLINDLTGVEIASRYVLHFLPDLGIIRTGGLPAALNSLFLTNLSEYYRRKKTVGSGKCGDSGFLIREGGVVFLERCDCPARKSRKYKEFT